MALYSEFNECYDIHTGLDYEQYIVQYSKSSHSVVLAIMWFWTSVTSYNTVFVLDLAVGERECE